jgi:BMFP domain-containing protein YqiC
MAEDLRVRGRSHFLAIASAEGGHPLSPPHELQTFQARVREAVPAFFESARAEVGAQLDARIDQGLLPHLRRWEELAEGLRQAAASLFEVPYLPTVARAPLERLREPYWVTEGTMAGFDSIPRRFLEALLPAGVRSRRLQQRLRREIGAIVLRNVEKLRWATIQNLEETFRDFRRRLEERLQQVAGDAQRAIRSGYDRRREQADTAAGALERLDVAHREVTDVLTDLEARLRS